MRRLLQILLPLLVLAGSAFVVRAMIESMQKPVVTPPPPNVPLIRVVAATPTTLTIDVESQGTVEPPSEVVLSPQVAGRVVAVSSSLRAGGFFAADETLVTIDDADLQLQLVQRQADVARAELRLSQERAEAEAAVRAWQALEGDREPTALSTRALFVVDAEQSLLAARAAVQRVQLDLSRTKVALPFAGRVKRTDVGQGQFAAVGAQLAIVYPTDHAEVRLPIPDADLAFLDVQLGQAATDVAGPEVELNTDFAGARHRWTGTIVRTEGEIDRRTRQLTLVARIADPYGPRGEAGRPPLAVGMFVEARIRGRRFDDVVTLPQQALRPDGTVLVVDAENHLRAQKVTVLRQDKRAALVRGSLQAGMRVCISRLDAFVDGMLVHVVDDATATPTIPADGGK